MLTITTDAIHLTRGDNASIIATLRDASGQIYQIQTGDKLMFTLKLNCMTEDKIIQKDMTSDSTLVLEHADTKDLDYGKYWFDVQLTTAGGDIYTVIPPHAFYIEKEVNFDV